MVSGEGTPSGTITVEGAPVVTRDTSESFVGRHAAAARRSPLGAGRRAVEAALRRQHSGLATAGTLEVEEAGPPTVQKVGLKALFGTTLWIGLSVAVVFIIKESVTEIVRPRKETFYNATGQWQESAPHPC